MKGRTILKILVSVLVVVVVGLVIWLLVAGLGRPESGAPPESVPPSRTPAAEANEVNGVTVSRHGQARGAISAAPLRAMTYQPKVRAYGTVVEVQELSDLRSAAAEARAKLEQAQANLTASHEAYVRLQSLYQQDRNISQKSLQQAEATWQSDTAAVQAAKVALESQEAGIDLSWGKTIGKWLKEDSPSLVRLLDRTDVLIQITVPVGTAIPTAPQNALIETPGGTTVTAAFVSESPRTTPRIQGLSFFYLVSSQATGLLSGMNVVAYLPTGSEVTGVYVPDSAVVRRQGQSWIYLQTGPTTFVRRAISTDVPVRNGWFVEKGLSAGQSCVIQGAQLLLSQEVRAEGQGGGED